MTFTRRTFIVATVIIACAIASLASCSKSDSGAASGGAGVSSGAKGTGGGSITGVYTSVDAAEVKIEFTSGGSVVMSMRDEKGNTGTYSVDGEKIIVDFGGQKTTFIRDGDCIEDAQHMFGRMCKGGAAGAAGNVSTRTPPPTAGTWSAANADGEFTIEFKSAGKFTMTIKPAASIPNAKPEAHEATYTLEGDTMYATLEDSTPITLKWVNGAYESSAFGLPMKFTKK